MAGNAFCLHDDLASAARLYGDIPVIAVNGASREVRAIALFSAHPERFMAKGFEWIKWQRKLNENFTVHGSSRITGEPWVQYWWPDTRGSGGSAWGARKVAWLMGFDPVILCGCPLVPGNYAGDRPGQIMAKQKVIDGLRQGIEEDTIWHDGVTSMSGWTRELLG